MICCMGIEREILITDTVEAILTKAHHDIWGRPFTAAESRYAWVLLTSKLLTSVVIDAQANIIREGIPMIDSLKKG